MNNITEHEIEVLVFRPTRDQRQAKANFWMRTYGEGGDIDPTPELEAAANISGYRALSKWWAQPGFQEWFYNRDEFRQRLEFLANQSLDHLETILLDEKANATAKVSAVKLIMDLARKTPQAEAAEVYLDEKISQMGKKELEDFLRSRQKLIPPQEIKLISNK